jgi:hypothetical protein
MPILPHWRQFDDHFGIMPTFTQDCVSPNKADLSSSLLVLVKRFEFGNSGPFWCTAEPQIRTLTLRHAAIGQVIRDFPNK